MSKPADLTGQHFGRLTVQRTTDQRDKHGYVLYECHCDCGDVVLTTASNLRRGRVTRCKKCKHLLLVKDISGQRFGRLTAIERLPDTVPNGSTMVHLWLCRCDCGKIVKVRSHDLLTGNTLSCGCLQRDIVRSRFADGTSPCLLREGDRKPRSSNSSGVTGVWYDKRRGLWAAELVFKRKKHYLGRYADIQDAIKARKDAEKHIFGDYLDQN